MKRLFTGLIGLALLVTLVSVLGPFRLVAIGASPLPSGCYTDSSGLAVCGPNYAGPGGTPVTPSPIPNDTVMGNISGVSATPAPVGVSALFDSIYGSTQGEVLYRGASAWLALAPGTAGQFLESGGAAANPSWASAGGGGGIVPQPSPTSSANVGYVWLTKGLVIGPTPSAAATYVPQALQLSTLSGQCNNGTVFWGTQGSDLGVLGDVFAFDCNPAGSEEFWGDHSGNMVARNSVLEANDAGSGGFIFYQASTEFDNCAWVGQGGQGIKVSQPSGSDQCPVSFAASQNKGQVSCTLSALTCTATATVISGMVCIAAYDGTATTVTAALLLPLEVNVSGTTMSVKMQGAATASGTAAADYHCH